eukprot:TRINITY_DN458_c0_g1_i3.p1 TRINITY_DN458_c0_g1~~TRINITY_DN458_c0_g1_i3.p1  ORF type:complete len:324 (-),score=41.61 TRINITY_DN458_c0_g1_i3:611-1582(-)
MAVSLQESSASQVSRALTSLLNGVELSVRLSLDCCEITIEHATQLAELLGVRPVVAFYLRGSVLPEGFIAAIAEVLPTCVSLKEIDLRWCSLNNADASALAHALPFSNLEELLLGNNCISTEGLKELIRSVSQSHTVRVLDLQNNDATLTDAAHLQYLFQEKNALQTVFLEGNRIPTKTLQYLVPFIVKNTSITKLSLSYPGGVSSQLKGLIGSVGMRNSLLAQMSRLCVVDKKVEMVQTLTEEDYDDWGKLSLTPKPESELDLASPTPNPEEFCPLEEVEKLKNLAMASIEDVSFYNAFLQKGIVEKLEAIANIIHNHTEGF